MIDLLRCLLGILGGRGLLRCQNDIRGQCVVSFEGVGEEHGDEQGTKTPGLLQEGPSGSGGG